MQRRVFFCSLAMMSIEIVYRECWICSHLQLQWKSIIFNICSVVFGTIPMLQMRVWLHSMDSFTKKRSLTRNVYVCVCVCGYCCCWMAVVILCMARGLLNIGVVVTANDNIHFYGIHLINLLIALNSEMHVAHSTHFIRDFFRFVRFHTAYINIMCKWLMRQYVLEMCQKQCVIRNHKIPL